MDKADHNETRDVARDTARATAGVDTESRYQRRRRLLNNARWGKDGKWAKMADTLESVPVLGETALAPMTGFLRGAMGLYSLLPYQGIRCSSGLLSLLLHHHHPCRNFTPSRLSLLSALLLRSSSFVVLPPTFCVSRVLACYASVWGPEYLWTLALYWGYKIRNLLEKLENLPLLALVTILWSLLALF